MRTTLRRLLKRLLQLAAAGVVLFLGLVISLGYRAFGHAAEGERLARMQRSPQWHAGSFDNPEPLVNDALGSLTGLFHAGAELRPSAAMPTERLAPETLRTPPSTGLRITWLGHSGALIEIDGARVLTDPMWSERSSPLPFIGPTRWFPPPIALRDLPRIDAVVISHDHYDHLDYNTIRAMKDWPTKFIVPLGVGAHLAYWGVPARNIVELDWWEHAQLPALDIVCTPARHASGRTLFDKDSKLWAGYALLSAKHRVFYSGDTGLHNALKDIGQRFGPFDVTLIEIGQYHRAWPDWHIGPEQAVLAHRWLRGRVLLPVHWGLLTLAYHNWTEPIERVLAEAERTGVSVVTPKPGQSFEPDLHPSFERWWPSVPWHSAAQDPIHSTSVQP